MKRLLSTLCAAMMALTTVSASSLTVSAAPYQAPRVEAGASDVIQVQNRIQLRRDGGRREFRRDRDRREFRRNPPRQQSRGFYRRGGNAYYNGHRGYRYQRPGYRYRDGYWFPGAAFIAGAIVGGALSAPPAYGGHVAPGRVSPSHVSWCYDRYRSYREYDNTFQPYNGPRRQCVSPYY